MSESGAGRCAVCGETVDDRALLANCFDCAEDYHLNPYSNRPGIDCGDAMIGETLGVHFYCNRCLEERSQAEAAAYGPHGRAGAAVEALHGASLPLPPAAQAPPPSPPPPARRRASPRRRYRRVDL
jgi:hypothetical protein